MGDVRTGIAYPVRIVNCQDLTPGDCDFDERARRRCAGRPRSSTQTADIRWRPARRPQPLINLPIPARRVRDCARQGRHERIATTETAASYQPESAIQQVAIHLKHALPGRPRSPPPGVVAAPPLSRILHGPPSPARLRSASAIAELPAFPVFCALSQGSDTPLVRSRFGA